MSGLLYLGFIWHSVGLHTIHYYLVICLSYGLLIGTVSNLKSICQRVYQIGMNYDKIHRVPCKVKL